MTHEHQGRTVDHGHHHDHDHHAHNDDHGHDGHGSSLWARMRHAVSELFGGHSHDAADQVDDVLEADAAGRRALLISLAGLALTAAIQAVGVGLSGSVALPCRTLDHVAAALS